MKFKAVKLLVIYFAAATTLTQVCFSQSENSPETAKSDESPWYIAGYQCDVPPSSTKPAWTSTPSIDKCMKNSDFKATAGLVDPGFLRIETSGGIKASCSYEGDAWNVGNEFTLEIRLRAIASLGESSPTVQVVAGDKKTRALLSIGTGYLRFGNKDIKATVSDIDPRNYNVYRIVGKKSSEKWKFTLFINGPEKKYAHGGYSGGTNQIIFGDLSGKPDVGGTFEVDYVRWNNKQAVEPKESMSNPALPAVPGKAQAVQACIFGKASESDSNAPAAKILDVKKIWDYAQHNGFTDLIFYKNKWYCTFREASAHVSNDGIVRVISSADGVQWKSQAKLAIPGKDMREFKFSIAPNGKLLLIGAACDVSSGNRGVHQSYVYQSEDGQNLTGPNAVGDPNFWMWRMLWGPDAAYSFGYVTNAYPNGPFCLRLFRSLDGVKWDTHIPSIRSEGFPNETAGLFLKDGTFVCLVRRDLGTTTALLGISKPPYKEWTWKDLGVRIGSPNLLQLPDGRIVAPIRLLSPMRAALCWLDIDKGALAEFLKLPSGGDSGYCGAVYRDGILWASYYSSHENKRACIYLAKVKLPNDTPGTYK